MPEQGGVVHRLETTCGSLARSWPRRSCRAVLRAGGAGERMPPAALLAGDGGGPRQVLGRRLLPRRQHPGLLVRSCRVAVKLRDVAMLFALASSPLECKKVPDWAMLPCEEMMPSRNKRLSRAASRIGVLCRLCTIEQESHRTSFQQNCFEVQVQRRCQSWIS